MLAELAQALEATALATTLRQSTLLYPLVNAGHILGIALLVGSIVPLDLRLLGVWRSLPLTPLLLVLRGTAAAGLALAAGCGVLLFMGRAVDYLDSGLFITKMGFVAAAVVNAVLVRGVLAPGRFRYPEVGPVPGRLRLAALVSLACWLSALVLGRLVGYF